MTALVVINFLPTLIQYHSDKLGNFVCGFFQYIFLSIYIKELLNISTLYLLLQF